MTYISPFRLAYVASAICLAAPAAAQSYGSDQPAYPSPYGSSQPSMQGQPMPGQPMPGQPMQVQPGPFPSNPYQPMPNAMPPNAMAPNFMPQNGGPSVLGAWSGQRMSPNGPIEQSDAFSGDGKFVSVARLSNGFLARAWGFYRATPIGPNQLRVDFQLQGWLPRQVCHQAPGYAPQCQPFQIPATDTALVTFSSPDQFQSVSQTNPGPPINEVRDNQAMLLQAQAPQQWVINEPPPQQAPIAPPTAVVTPYQSPINRGPATNIPGLGGNCDDLQQRRICSINNGALVRGSNGCLVCTGS